MDDKQLLEFNSMGLIPGPLETEQDFLSRVDYCLKLNQHLPFILSDQSQTIKQFKDHSLETTKQHFDIAPSWVHLQFSNYQLRPWHGGSAWIFQENDDLPVSAFIQLRKKFAYKKKYLKLYERNELIAHELAHVGRMMFEEPKFEELLAYRTSNSSFRRFFGSIIQSSTESMIFMLSIFSILFLDFFVIAYQPEVYVSFNLLKLIPLGMIAYAVLRLWNRQQIFNKTLNKLKKIAKREELAEAIIYRLQDDEIESFSKLSIEEIQRVINEGKDKSLRFRLIYLAYIKPYNLLG